MRSTLEFRRVARLLAAASVPIVALHVAVNSGGPGFAPV
jgi:hypothetical protein